MCQAARLDTYQFCIKNWGENKGIKFVKVYDNVHLLEVQKQIVVENRNKSGIYLIINKVNGKCYVGSAITNRIQVRFRNHFFHQSVACVILNRAVKQYGVHCFMFCILEYHAGFIHHEDFKKAHLQLLERETHHISSLNPEYNILKVGGSSYGFKHSIDSLVKMKLNYSQERKNKIKNLNLNKKLSENTKALLSDRPKLRFAQMDAITKQNITSGHLVNFACMKKPILLLNDSGEIIKEFESQQAAGKGLGCSARTIRRALYDKNRIGKKFRVFGFLKLKNVE
jgi:group I intron endonuclease